jgi:hypothetical protein
MNCKCGNAARYINERGELCCAICPLGEGIDSIRLADVPALLAWARKFANLHTEHPWLQSLREIIGRGPARVSTSADGKIIGEPLAQRLAVREKTP